MDTRDAPGKVVVRRGRRRPVASGGAVLTERDGRRLVIVPGEVSRAPEPLAAPQAAPSPVAAPTAVSNDAARESASRRRKTYRLILGTGAAVFVLGFAVL
jgi:hypothetical protein